MNRLLSWCRCLAAGAPLALAPAPLLAEHRGEVSEHDFLAELPVVLSASRLAQPLRDAPGAVTVIDRDLIKASGAREIADLFRLIPGFNVSFANGANPVVNYHGLQGEFNPAMQVLVDGRPSYSPFFVGGVNWNLLPIALDDIERIEVLRGSNSAAYGANAFLGVANIITREPSQARGVLASASLGDQGIRDNVFRYGGGAGGLDYRFTAGRRRDSGFNGVNDTRHVSFFNVRGDLRLDTRDVLQVHFGANEASTGAGFAGRADDPPRDQSASHYFAQLQWRRALGPDEEVSLLGYHVRDGGVESYPTFVGRVPSFVDWGRRTEQSNLELQHIFRPWAGTRLVWGLAQGQERVRSRFIFADEAWHEATRSRLFGNLEWRAQPWLLVNAGAMAERYSLTGTDLSPRLMLNLQPHPEHTLRVGVSKAIRTPALMEEQADIRLYSNGGIFLGRLFLGNGELQPERILARELSYLGEFRDYRTTLDVRLFDERVSRLVTTDPIAVGSITRIFLNAYRARVRGLEYEARWRPEAGTLVSLGQAFVRIRGVERLDAGADSTADDLMRSAPSHRTTLFASTRLPADWRASLIHHWVGAMIWSGGGDPVPKYRRLDLTLARSFKLGGRRAEAALTTQNFFAPYAEFRPDYKFTRRSFATFGLEF